MKLTLERTMISFKRFYRMFSLIYFVLFPFYMYAVIELFMPYWRPFLQTKRLTYAMATVAAIVLNYWHYKVKFFQQLQSLEADLEALQG